MNMRSISLCMCLSIPGAVTAQAGMLVEPLPSMTTLELQSAYLACDSAATIRQLEVVEAARCSMVAERLKHSHFDGDFDRMLAWWRRERESSARLTQRNP